MIHKWDSSSCGNPMKGTVGYVEKTKEWRCVVQVTRKIGSAFIAKIDKFYVITNSFAVAHHFFCMFDSATVALSRLKDAQENPMSDEEFAEMQLLMQETTAE